MPNSNGVSMRVSSRPRCRARGRCADAPAGRHALGPRAARSQSRRCGGRSRLAAVRTRSTPRPATARTSRPPSRDEHGRLAFEPRDQAQESPVIRSREARMLQRLLRVHNPLASGSPARLTMASMLHVVGDLIEIGHQRERRAQRAALAGSRTRTITWCPAAVRAPPAVGR